MHDDDVNYIEDFIKNRLNILLIRNGTSVRDEVSIDETELVNYFGPLFAQNPREFSFNRGERKLIKELVAYVDKTVRDKGLQYFKMPEKVTKLFNRFKNANGRELVPLRVENKNAALKRSFFEEMVTCLNLFKTIDRGTIENLNKDLAVIKVENDNIIADFNCVLCEKKNIAESIRANYFQEGWMFSNFKRHLIDVHHVLNYRARISISSKQYTQTSTLYECIEEKDLTLNNSSTSEHLVAEMGYGDQETLLCEQILSQIKNMAKIALKHSETREIMYVNVEEISPIIAAKIEPDGSCLFGALAHQLFFEKINSTEHRKSMKKLREDVVIHIKRNFKSFENVLIERVHDWKRSSTILDVQKECNIFLNKCLPKPGFWGGSETIKAVAEIYNTNVFIFYENGPVYISYDLLNVRSVAVAYRMATHIKDQCVRNHYDSVCGIKSNEIYKIIKKEMHKRNSNEVIILDDSTSK